jgi:hypothetical protein
MFIAIHSNDNTSKHIITCLTSVKCKTKDRSSIIIQYYSINLWKPHFESDALRIIADILSVSVVNTLDITTNNSYDIHT